MQQVDNIEFIDEVSEISVRICNAEEIGKKELQVLNISVQIQKNAIAFQRNLIEEERNKILEKIAIALESKI